MRIDRGREGGHGAATAAAAEAAAAGAGTKQKQQQPQQQLTVTKRAADGLSCHLQKHVEDVQVPVAEHEVYRHTHRG